MSTQNTIKHEGMGMKLSYSPENVYDGEGMLRVLAWKQPALLTIEWKEQLLYVEIKGNYQQMATKLAKAFADTSMALFRASLIKRLKNARGLPPELVKMQGSAKPHYKKAAYILRWLRTLGVELAPLYHPLQRRCGYPEGPPPQEFVDMWNKDHVFRGVCLLHRNDSWQFMLTCTMESEARIIQNLPKPLRRRLAQKRMSVAVAYAISGHGKHDMDLILKAPMWALGSTNALRRWIQVKWAEGYIRQFGRSPSKDFTRLTHKTLPSDVAEWGTAIYSFGQAGGVVPTSFKGVKKLVADLHERRSLAYRLVNNRNRRTDVWVPCMPLPALPDIGASVRILESAQDYTEEGLSMNHCIGMYAGTKGLFAHLERGEDKASLFLSAEGHSYQCLGPFNRINPLTRDVIDHWLPTLREWIGPDKFVNKTPEPEALVLPEYD